MNPVPLIFTWTGDAMVPVHLSHARRQFAVGEEYRLEVREERSINSHNHYFAVLTEAWQNLPESLADRFPSPDHLRKWCLIKAGYRDERSFACASQNEARSIAAFIRPLDDFAVITVRDRVLVVYTAKSQSIRAMGRKEFTASKNAVLDVLAKLLAVNAPDLEKNAGRAA